MFLKTSYAHLDGKGCWMTVRDTLPPRLPGPISLLEVAHRRLRRVLQWISAVSPPTNAPPLPLPATERAERTGLSAAGGR